MGCDGNLTHVEEKYTLLGCGKVFQVYSSYVIEIKFVFRLNLIIILNTYMPLTIVRGKAELNLFNF